MEQDLQTGPRRPEHILVVDDDVWIIEVISKQLDLAGFTVDTTTYSAEVMDMLQTRPYDLVISDICMPEPDGLMLLKQIRQAYPFLGVLMLTAVNDIEIATQAMKDGASDYLVKPHRNTQLLVRVERALERSHLLREKALAHELLEKRVNEQTHTLREQSNKLSLMLKRLLVTYKATLKALEAALDVRDQSAPGHCRRVSKLAVRLAQKVGLSGKDLVDIEHGALLHDIGKLGIPDAILMKPGPLTPQERKTVQRHPEIGSQIVGHIDFLRGALPIIRCHHERYDGSGYPEGLGGEDIPILARIFSVVDAFDALTNQRPYNTVHSLQTALEELRQNKGTFFDPRIVDAFIEMMQNQDVNAKTIDEPLVFNEQKNSPSEIPL